MSTRYGTAIASTAVATAVAVVLAVSGQAETARASKPVLTSRATATTSRLAVSGRPPGVVVDCSTRSGFEGFFGVFTNHRLRNLVVGPLVLMGAGGTPTFDPAAGGQKFQLLVSAGHRVTVELLDAPAGSPGSPMVRCRRGRCTFRHPSGGDVHRVPARPALGEQRRRAARHVSGRRRARTLTPVRASPCLGRR